MINDVDKRQEFPHMCSTSECAQGTRRRGILTVQEDEGAKDRPEEEEEDKDEARGIGTEDRVHKGRGKVKITISRGKSTVGWTSCTRLRFISGKTTGVRGEECDNVRGRVRYTFHKRVNPCPGREHAQTWWNTRLITTGRKQEERNGRKLDYPSAKGSFFIGEYS